MSQISKSFNWWRDSPARDLLEKPSHGDTTTGSWPTKVSTTSENTWTFLPTMFQLPWSKTRRLKSHSKDQLAQEENSETESQEREENIEPKNLRLFLKLTSKANKLNVELAQPVVEVSLEEEVVLVVVEVHQDKSKFCHYKIKPAFLIELVEQTFFFSPVLFSHTKNQSKQKPHRSCLTNHNTKKLKNLTYPRRRDHWMTAKVKMKMYVLVPRDDIHFKHFKCCSFV